MNIDKKRLLDSLILSVVVINLLFMVLFSAGFFKLSTPSGNKVETSEDFYGSKVSYTIAETDSGGPPFYLNLGVFTVINVFCILLFAGLIYFIKDYFYRKNS